VNLCTTLHDQLVKMNKTRVYIIIRIIKNSSFIMTGKNTETDRQTYECFELMIKSKFSKDPDLKTDIYSI